jgi:hypothetical protein
MRENTLASEQTKPVVSRILPSSPSWVRIKCDSRDPAQDRIREGGNVLISFVFSFIPPAVRTQIVQPPVDTRVILGHVATMQCRVSGDSSVSYSVQWRHENK